MRVLGRKIIKKYQKKNIGNHKLCIEIDRLLHDLDSFNGQLDKLIVLRNDADCVHSDGFYFFNINIHRVLILIEMTENDATIIWVGSHQDYVRTFKNNKVTIEKWLRERGYIDDERF